MKSRRTITDKIIESVRSVWVMAGQQKWILGISGGADSTALLLACVMAEIPVEAIHCNFNLRGKESLRDREFVKDLCDTLNIPLVIQEFNVDKECRKGESTEMVCRRLRYSLFTDLAKEKNCGKIAVAHNSDDNAETLFINLLRGSGCNGLKAMERLSGNIIRPLLEYSRKDILQFLDENETKFIVDSTNLESDYRRNFLRNEIFPMLASRWEGFDSAISRSIDILQRENRILEHYISTTLEPYSNTLPWKTISNFPDSETLIFRFIQPFGGSPAIAAEIARHAIDPLPGKKWKIIDTLYLISTSEGLMTYNPTQQTKDKPEDKYGWKRLTWEDISMEKLRSAGCHIAFLPFGPEEYEWVKADPTLTMLPIGMKGSQKVWKILKDNSIPLPERANIDILICKASGQPIWIPGSKRSRLQLLNGKEECFYKVYPKDSK